MKENINFHFFCSRSPSEPISCSLLKACWGSSTQRRRLFQICSSTPEHQNCLWELSSNVLSKQSATASAREWKKIINDSMNFNFKCTIISSDYSSTDAQRVRITELNCLSVKGGWCMAEQFELILKIISQFDYLSRRSQSINSMEEFFPRSHLSAAMPRRAFYWNVNSDTFAYLSNSLPMKVVIFYIFWNISGWIGAHFSYSRNYYWKHQRAALQRGRG